MGYKFGPIGKDRSVKKLKKFLNDLVQLDMRDLHKALGQTGVNIVEERFDKFVDPKGKRWKPLKFPYKIKIGTRVVIRRINAPLKLLQLYKSFTSEATEEKVLVGTPIEYAKFHTDAPTNNQRSRRKIPLREFMGYETQKDGDRLLDVVEDFLDSKTEKGS